MVRMQVSTILVFITDLEKLPHCEKKENCNFCTKLPYWEKLLNNDIMAQRECMGLPYWYFPLVRENLYDTRNSRVAIFRQKQSGVVYHVSVFSSWTKLPYCGSPSHPSYFLMLLIIYLPEKQSPLLDIRHQITGYLISNTE